MSSFVSELLKIGKLTSQQKDRLIELIYQTENQAPQQISQAPQQENLPKYIEPFGNNSLSKFLLAYNQDPLLKYTWHTIDSETTEYEGELLSIKDYIIKLSKTEQYSVKEHQKLLIERFDNLAKEYFINPQIKALLRVYLSGKNFNNEPKKWSSDNIDINWASEELLKWSDENPDFVPNAAGDLRRNQKDEIFEITNPFTSKINGNRVRDFCDLIIHCKNLFHIRADNSLKDILENTINNNDDWMQKIDFDFENVRGRVELFTDVDKLTQFFKEYINFLLRDELPDKYKTQKKQKIILSFTEKDSFVLFTIHHIHPEHPFFGKSSQSTCNRVGNTFSSMINKINGMCNLYLEADFEDEPSYEINLWSREEWKKKEYTRSSPEKKEIEKVGGVKLILKFKQ